MRPTFVCALRLGCMTTLACVPDPVRTSSSSPLAAALARCGDPCTRELLDELHAADATLVEHGAGVASSR